jgi:hypothetical protein
MNVQFDQNGILGHCYWMTMTPYPFRDDDKENPSILVSENGLDWSEPPGLVNPVSGLPPDVTAGGHYSDSYLLVVPEGFELWFRYNPARADARKPDNSTNIIYRMTSPDGVKWSDKETILDGGPAYLSPSLLIEPDRSRLWYSDYGGEMLHIQSADRRSWSEPETVLIELADSYVPWHQEIIQTDLGYEALVLGYQPDDGAGAPFALFYAVSEDGLDWGRARQLKPENVDPWLAGSHFYKSSLVKADGVYQLYLSTVSPDGAQRPFYKQVKVEDLDSLLG